VLRALRITTAATLLISRSHSTDYPSNEALDDAGGGGCSGRDVPATGRGSRHPGRERGTV